MLAHEYSTYLAKGHTIQRNTACINVCGLTRYFRVGWLRERERVCVCVCESWYSISIEFAQV